MSETKRRLVSSLCETSEVMMFRSGQIPTLEGFVNVILGLS